MFSKTPRWAALHVVIAVAADTRMVVGQVAAGDKESEIMAAGTLPGHPDSSIRRRRKRAGWSGEFTRSVHGQMR